MTEASDDDVQPLSVREGRRLPRGAPHEAVPRHLDGPLRHWLDKQLNGHLERRIALRLEVTVSRRAAGSPYSPLAHGAEVDLLDVVDLVLQLDEGLRQDLEELDEQAEDIRAEEDGGAVFLEVPEAVEELDDLLTDGNSTYRVARQARPLQLGNVVDSTVATAATATIEDAPETAGDLLASAWVAAHAVHPDLDGAYRDAVRAVEHAIARVVSPNNQVPTLGTAIRDLRNGTHNYELVLLDKGGDGSVEPLALLLQRLWEGQKSRHGGGSNSRSQTLEEARAAVQIAVLVVQWLTDGALRRRCAPAVTSSSGTS